MTSSTGALSAEEVERLTTAATGLARREVASLSRGELLDAQHAVARLTRVVGALGAVVAGEVQRRSAPDAPGGGFARVEGFGTPGAMVSRIGGSTVASAKRAIEAGDAFTVVPDDRSGAAPSGDDAGRGSAAAGDAEPGDAPPSGAAPAGAAPAGASRGDDAPPGAAPEARTRAKYPFVAQASVAGDLSVDAAGLIVAGLNRVVERVDADALAEVERRLVDKAQGRAAHEVRALVARAIARLDREALVAQERRNHEERYLWWKQDHSGMVTIHGKLDAVTAAPVIDVLEQMTTRDVRRQSRGAQQRAKQSGSGLAGGAAAAGAVGDVDHRTVGQMRADALFELARHALGCRGTNRSGVRTSIVVRMDLADLMRGEGLGSIDGIDTPVSVSELRRLAGDAGYIPEVLAADGEVLDLGHQSRDFTLAQRRALLERDGGCAKCHAPPQHCEAHHIRWWVHGGRTDLSNGVMLCTRCHHDMHRQGWQIETDGRRVTFIPPEYIDASRAPQAGGIDALDLADLHPPPPPWVDEDWDKEAAEQLVRELEASLTPEQRIPSAVLNLVEPWHLAPG